jgi:hypothetical protein
VEKARPAETPGSLFGGDQDRFGMGMAGAFADRAGGATLTDASLAHDRADGACAAATIRAAAQARIDLADGARAVRPIAQAGADVVVTQHIAMTDDHRMSPPQPLHCMEQIRSIDLDVE